MATGPNGLDEWVGSAYLFVESSLDKVVLSDAYAHAQQKVPVYRALRTALTGVWVGGYLEKKGRALTFCGWDQGAEAHLLNSVGGCLTTALRERFDGERGRRGEGWLVS